MLVNGFKNDGSDQCVYIKITRSLFVWDIGDMLIIYRYTNDTNATKHMLESNVDMKDREVLDVILGIRFLKTPRCLALSRFYYIEKVLD